MLPRLMCAALALTLLYAPARAEEKKQPELRIRLVIEQAVFPPHQSDRVHDRDDAAVIYKLAPTSEGFSIKTELRPMLVEDGRHEQVQLTTVVLK